MPSTGVWLPSSLWRRQSITAQTELDVIVVLFSICVEYTCYIEDETKTLCRLHA